MLDKRVTSYKDKAAKLNLNLSITNTFITFNYVFSDKISFNCKIKSL